MPAFMLSRVFLLVSLLVAALLAGASGLWLVNAGDDTGPTRGLPTAGPVPTLSPTAEQTPSPTPTPEPTATASPTPSAAPTATATATATASPRPRATRTATASPTATRRTYAYPKPTRSYAPLAVTMKTGDGAPEAGQLFKITVVATDGDGEIYFNGLTWGDGDSEPAHASPRKCRSYPPLTSPPGAYQPQPDKKNYAFTHRYLTPGTYTVTVRMASVNADCRPNGPRDESQSVKLTIQVRQPAP